MDIEDSTFNDSKFELKFVKFAGLTILAVSFLLILWKISCFFYYYTEISYSKYSVAILFFGILYFILGLLIIFKKEHFLKHINLLSAISMINMLYIAIELILYFATGFSNIEFNPHQDKRTFIYNQPSLKYDNIRGYRWTKNNARQVLLSPNQKVIWDSKINCNNVGYISKQDYFFKKKNKNTKRYIVLGDSFSAPEFNNNTWVDYADSLLKKDNIELYSFSLSGIGLQNWHSIYFKEI